MSASIPQLAFAILCCLGACLPGAVRAQAMVPGGEAMPPAPPLVVAQATQPSTQPATQPALLPSLVLPPDATAGPPAFVTSMRMGDSAMLRGNILQARQFYERASAAQPASTAALLAVGKTYDPRILASLGASDFADAALARRWYERARALGDPASAALLAPLP